MGRPISAERKTAVIEAIKSGKLTTPQIMEQFKVGRSTVRRFSDSIGVKPLYIRSGGRKRKKKNFDFLKDENLRIEAMAAKNGKLLWMDAANCASTEPEAFFPGRGDGYSNVEPVCNRCDVQKLCLVWTLITESNKSRSDRFGMSGGATPYMREELSVQYGFKESTDDEQDNIDDVPTRRGESEALYLGGESWADSEYDIEEPESWGSEDLDADGL